MTSEATMKICIAVAAMTCLLASDARATPQYQFCSSWMTNYSDSDGTPNSDWSWGAGNKKRWAQHARVDRYTRSGSGYPYVYQGTQYLSQYNSDSPTYYCTPPASVPAGGDVKYIMMTQLKSSNRMMLIIGDSTTWTSPGLVGNSYEFDVPNINDYEAKVYGIPTSAHLKKQTNMAHVGRQLMSLGSSLSWTNSLNERIMVNMDPSECGGYYDDYVSPYHRICFGKSTDQINKFTAGHELGHAISHMNVPSGPGGNSTYGGDQPGSLWEPGSASALCKSNQTHFIHSREYIGSAQKEGFSHFVGAALFNVREPNAGFKYYRDNMWYDPTGTDPWDSYNKPWLNWGDQDKIMKNNDSSRYNCAVAGDTMSGIMGLGVEWDWAEFYWQLWAHGNVGQKWEMSMLFDAWEGTDPVKLYCTSATNCVANDTYGYIKVGRPWQFLYEEGVVDATTDATKRARFNNLGKDTAANYYDYTP